MTQQIKLQIPNGFEIDLENSTAEEIALKPIKKQLPKTWEELGEIKGYWIGSVSTVENTKAGYSCCENNRNMFATEPQAKASIAMAQLSQLREVYRQGWEPTNYQVTDKYAIHLFNKKLEISSSRYFSEFLTFQSKEIAEEFLTNFKDLIIEAAPLLFGEEIAN
jgi:hypothetical protein